VALTSNDRRTLLDDAIDVPNVVDDGGGGGGESLRPISVQSGRYLDRSMAALLLRFK